MNKLFHLIICISILCITSISSGCGSETSVKAPNSPSVKRTYIGLYLGYYEVYVDKLDGTGAQLKYALYTTDVSSGIYMDSIPLAAFINDDCILERTDDSKDVTILFGNKDKDTYTSSVTGYMPNGSLID